MGTYLAHEVQAHDLETPRPMCNRRRWSGTRLCSMPADVLLTGMCVHEHSAESAYCEHHAVDALAGKFACIPCRLNEPSHDCAVHPVAEKWLSPVGVR